MHTGNDEKDQKFRQSGDLSKTHRHTVISRAHGGTQAATRFELFYALAIAYIVTGITTGTASPMQEKTPVPEPGSSRARLAALARSITILESVTQCPIA